jgi:hypothetical protein
MLLFQALLLFLTALQCTAHAGIGKLEINRFSIPPTPLAEKDVSLLQKRKLRLKFYPGRILADKCKLISHSPVLSSCAILTNNFHELDKIITNAGEGGFSSVYLANNTVDHSLVAIKITKSAAALDMAKSEIKTLELIKQHDPTGRKHCLMIKDHFMLDGAESLVFEFLPLALFDFQQLNGFRPFSYFQIHSFTRQILEGLTFLHDDLNLVHGDLKQENIMLVHDDSVKVNLPPPSVSDETRDLFLYILTLSFYCIALM